jgi:hypothetical protein
MLSQAFALGAQARHLPSPDYPRSTPSGTGVVNTFLTEVSSYSTFGDATCILCQGAAILLSSNLCSPELASALLDMVDIDLPLLLLTLLR